MTKAQNNGLAMQYKDTGLGALNRPRNDPFTPSNDGKFKASSLRNVELTAPYGHAGQFAELLTIVAHYDGIDERLLAYDPTQVEAALQNTVLDNFAEILTNRDTILIPIELDDGEAEMLTAFLVAMTDDAARDLTAIVPATVPSGLPVDR